jgi:hypothetical protein
MFVLVLYFPSVRVILRSVTEENYIENSCLKLLLDTIFKFPTGVVIEKSLEVTSN